MARGTLLVRNRKRESSTETVQATVDNAQEDSISETKENKTKDGELRPAVDSPNDTMASKSTYRFDVVIFFLALGLRLWRLDYPRSIVFDELHYGRFISMYIRGIFFFDSQPPLGKQMIAAISYLGGYDGTGTNFTAIGAPYDVSTPLKALRLLPVLCGSLLVPVIYETVLVLGLSHKTAFLGALFYLLENTFLTQSRFILMDMIQICFSMIGLLATLKSRKLKVFSMDWFFTLFIASTFLSLGLCVKFTGFYTITLAFILIMYDFWWVIADHSIKLFHLAGQFSVYVSSFVIWPLVIYIAVFYVHLSWLTKAGPHDNVLTSAFQASLEGGLASITKGQPLEIVHGSQITLRHTHGRTCWLHSHPQVYPVRYSDSRGSSHQQQVTCYSFKDVNNWWIVKKPQHDELVVHEPLERIRDGDIVQLIHGITGRSLNSHDVAAPVSPQFQEVSCYIDYNISMPSQNLWKVNLLNPEETNGIWHTIRSLVNLIHVNSSQALKFSGKQLPDWGFNQHEIVTDRLLAQDDTIWNVEEHRYTKDADQKDRERDMVQAQFVPLEATSLTFWSKMKELQYKMIFGSNHDKVDGHMYQVESPLAWVLLYQGIAYWLSPESNSQVYLIGNLVLWYTSLVSMILYTSVFIGFMIRRRRQCFDLPEEYWNKLTFVVRLTCAGYLINFLPYFFMEKSLFLHHYLPAVLFKHIALAASVELVSDYLQAKSISRLYIAAAVILMLSAFLHCFLSLLPLSYGSGNLSAKDITSMKWRNSWHFIIHDE